MKSTSFVLICALFLFAQDNVCSERKDVESGDLLDCGACSGGLEHLGYGKFGKVYHLQQSWRRSSSTTSMCKSRGKIWDHYLPNTEYWGRAFEPNLYNETLYTCNFAWNGHVQALHAWERQTYTLPRCVICEWHVFSTGFYVREDEDNYVKFVVGWN